MADPITLDFSQFDAALKQYAEASDKDFVDIQNKKMGDLAFRAAQFSRVGNKAAIRSLPETDPVRWCKIINTILGGTGYVLHGRRKATAAEASQGYRDASTGKWISTRKSVGYDKMATLQSSRAMKRRVSASIIKRRAATVGGFKALFAWVAAKFVPEKVTKIGGKNFYRIAIKKASKGDFVADFTIPFKSARDGKTALRLNSDSDTVRGKVAIGMEALRKAMTFVIADMEVYTQRKMQQTANRFSARRAA